MDIEKIGKAMAKCFCSKVETEAEGYKFEFVDGDYFRAIKVLKDGELISKPNNVVAANTILHREKLEKTCEEQFSWAILKRWAKEEKASGTDLYEALVTKCVDNGIPIDYLDRHSKDILR